MAIDPVLINSWLDVILRIVILVLLGLIVLLVRDVDRAVKRSSRAAEDLSDSLKHMGEFMLLGKITSWLRGRRGKNKDE